MSTPQNDMFKYAYRSPSYVSNSQVSKNGQLQSSPGKSRPITR
jgi:hypothetical protein